MKVHARFLSSVTDPERFPVSPAPEIAFLGRSNVGKSSLLNSLVGAKQAHVSSTPGRTRSINFFEVRLNANTAIPDLLLADLPGYGYAKISKSISAEWPKFIDPYLTERQNLALCIVLVDSNVPAQDSDRQLLDFLRSAERSFVVVGTKSDRLSANRLKSALKQLSSGLEVENILPYSVKTGAGRAELWRAIRNATATKS